MRERRVKPPAARIEVRGAAQQIERVAAEARQGARILGRMALAAAKVLFGLFIVGGLCWMFTSRSRVERADHLQLDLQRIQDNLDRSIREFRTLEAYQRLHINLPALDDTLLRQPTSIR